MKMYNATKHAVGVLCEGLRHELQLVGSKIKVSVCTNYKQPEAHFIATHNTVRVRIKRSF